MGVGTAIAAATGLQVGGGLFSGIQNKNAADKTAREVRSEAEYLAKQKREETEDVIQKQKMSYIKSGIELTPDSPLLMLADTRAKGYEEASRISKRGYKQAKNIKRQGRNSLIGSLFGVAGSGLQGYASYKYYGK